MVLLYFDENWELFRLWPIPKTFAAYEDLLDDWSSRLNYNILVFAKQSRVTRTCLSTPLSSTLYHDTKCHHILAQPGFWLIKRWVRQSLSSNVKNQIRTISTGQSGAKVWSPAEKFLNTKVTTMFTTEFQRERNERTRRILGGSSFKETMKGENLQDADWIIANFFPARIGDKISSSTRIIQQLAATKKTSKFHSFSRHERGRQQWTAMKHDYCNVRYVW